MPRYPHTYALSLLSILSIIGSPFIIAEGGGNTLSEEPPVIMSTPPAGDTNSTDTPENIINSLNTPMSPTISEDTPAVSEDELVGDVSEDTTSSTEEITPPGDEATTPTPPDPDPSAIDIHEPTPEPEEPISESIASETTADTPVIEPSDPIGTGKEEEEEEEVGATPVQASTTHAPRVIQLTITLPSGER